MTDTPYPTVSAVTNSVPWTEWSEFAAELLVAYVTARREGNTRYQTPRINCLNAGCIGAPFDLDEKELLFTRARITRRPWKTNPWRQLYARHYCSENEAVLHITHHDKDEMALCGYEAYLIVKDATSCETKS